MNIFILISLWVAPALMWMLWDTHRVRTQMRHRNHDRILYSLCEVRDFMAVKAASGELSEKSRVFQYFFGFLADLIHDHKNHQLCFKHLAVGVKKSRQQVTPSKVKQLLREIKKSDQQTQAMIGKYVLAVHLALEEDKRLAFVERIQFLSHKNRDVFKQVSKQPIFFSEETRTFARWVSSVKHAAESKGLELTTC